MTEPVGIQTMAKTAFYSAWALIGWSLVLAIMFSSGPGDITIALQRIATSLEKIASKS